MFLLPDSHHQEVSFVIKNVVWSHPRLASCWWSAQWTTVPVLVWMTPEKVDQIQPDQIDFLLRRVQGCELRSLDSIMRLQTSIPYSKCWIWQLWSWRCCLFAWSICTAGNVEVIFGKTTPSKHKEWKTILFVPNERIGGVAPRPYLCILSAVRVAVTM